MITAMKNTRHSGRQNIHHQVLWFHFVNRKILLLSSLSCAEWQIWGAELSFLHVSISALSREDGKSRNGTTKFSSNHLAVDISRCRTSCCAEQPRVSMAEQESIFKSGAWTYVSCKWRAQTFIFRLTIYRRERQADTWPVESKIFLFLFSAALRQSRNRVATPPVHGIGWRRQIGGLPLADGDRRRPERRKWLLQPRPLLAPGSQICRPHSIDTGSTRLAAMQAKCSKDEDKASVYSSGSSAGIGAGCGGDDLMVAPFRLLFSSTDVCLCSTNFACCCCLRM